jgi:hypothetical protein
MEKDRRGLCWRCEHRAKYLETGRRPRFECGDVEHCSYGCYMYEPVRPVMLKKREGDDRPQFGPYMISARSVYAGMPDMDLNVKKLENGNVLYWRFEK